MCTIVSASDLHGGEELLDVVGVLLEVCNLLARRRRHLAPLFLRPALLQTMQR